MTPPHLLPALAPNSAPTLAPRLPLLLLALACTLATTPLAAAEPPPASIAFSAEQIKSLGIVTSRPVATTAAAGTPLSAKVIASPDAEWVVTAATGGVVVRVPVAEGDVVQPGTVLAELSSAEAPQLAAELAQAEAAAKLARSERERDRQLHADGIIAARRLQASEQAAAQAEAQLSAVQTRFRVMGLASADAARGRVLLRAPAAATVLERLAMPGQRLAAADPVLRLVDAGRLMLELQVPSSSVAFRPGDRLRLPDGREATVRQAGWAASDSAQTVRVRAALPAGPTALRPGQWLKVQRETGAGAVAWILPTTAVVRRNEGAVVFAREPAGFRAVPVEVLASEGGSSTVAGALSADDAVASRGTIAIKGAWLGHGGGE